LTLGGAGTLLGAEATKNLLQQGSMLITGSRESYFNEKFGKQAIEAFILAMDSERKKALNSLIVGMSNPYSKFSFQRAFTSVQNYHNKGSMVSAIVKMYADAGSANSQAQKDLDEAQVQTGTYIKSE
jgi:hypothetical protein